MVYIFLFINAGATDVNLYFKLRLIRSDALTTMDYTEVQPLVDRCHIWVLMDWYSYIINGLVDNSRGPWAMRKNQALVASTVWGDSLSLFGAFSAKMLVAIVDVLCSWCLTGLFSFSLLCKYALARLCHQTTNILPFNKVLRIEAKISSWKLHWIVKSNTLDTIRAFAPPQDCAVRQHSPF